MKLLNITGARYDIYDSRSVTFITICNFEALRDLNLHNHEDIANSFYHFNFLKDIKIHGIYLSTIDNYLSRYPFLKDPHYHDFYSIVIFTGGKGSINICNETYRAYPQTLFLIAPAQIHSYEGLAESDGMIFLFCQDFYVEEFSYIRLLNVSSFITSSENRNACNKIEFTLPESSSLVDILKTIRSEYDHCCPGDNSRIIIRSLLNVFLLKLSGLYENRIGKSTTGDSILIHSLTHLIESNFFRERSIGFYAEAINISEKHLNDICNRHFSCGLKSILHERLMQESRKLLVASELSVSEIAYKLNFEDNSYFNKVFRKSTGITPKRFRELHRKLLP